MNKKQLKSDEKTINLNTKIKILLVDDQQISLLFINQILKNIGFKNIDEVMSGAQAIELFQKNAYDLIIMDCEMPEMTGYETTKNIRDIENDQNTPIIIASTGHTTEGSKEKCLAAGMDDYICKPVNKDKLETLLYKWFVEGDVQEQNIDSYVATEIKQIPVFDWDHLSEYTGGNKELEASFLKTFSDNLKMDIANLQSSFDKEDFKEWHEGAHKLHGGCSYMGAKALANICNEGQKTNIDNESDIDRIHSLVLQEYGNVLQEIKTRYQS